MLAYICIGALIYYVLCLLCDAFESRVIPKQLPMCLRCGKQFLGSRCFTCLPFLRETNPKNTKSTMKDITPTNLIED